MRKSDSIQAPGAIADSAGRSPEVTRPLPVIEHEWQRGLDRRDWLLDGHAIHGLWIKRFNNLDWSQAWVDIGPSPTGNLGPYWHVALRGGETVHRLYPKVLQSKWLLLIRQACIDYARLEVTRSKDNSKFPHQVIATKSPQSQALPESNPASASLVSSSPILHCSPGLRETSGEEAGAGAVLKDDRK